MSVERIVFPGTISPRAARAASASNRLEATRVVARPAIAGRELMTRLLHRNVLMQLIVSMALISGAALIYLNQAAKVSVLEFSIADLQQQQLNLRLESSNLYATASSLQSLERIETAASTKLHMTIPPYKNIIWIRPVVPVVANPPNATGGQAAQTDSQPLAWMQHAIQVLGAQF